MIKESHEQICKPEAAFVLSGFLIAYGIHPYYVGPQTKYKGEENR